MWWEIAAVILLVEYMTGPFIHLGVWYTIPIGLAAWYHGWQWSVPLAVAMPLGRFSMFLSALWEHPEGLQAPGVNALTRTVGLVVIAVVVSHFGRQARSASVDLQGLEEIRRRLPAELAALEHAAESAPLHLRAQLFTQAGDLCVATGEQPRAMAYFGRAIDTYLQDERLDSAAALCQRVTWVAPEVVRAHATLASIAMAKHLMQDADQHLAAYVQAANRTGQKSLAIARLRVMANATDDESALRVFEVHLSRLDASVVGSHGVPSPPSRSQSSRRHPALYREWYGLIRVARMEANELTLPGSPEQPIWQRTDLLPVRKAGGSAKQTTLSPAPC